MQRLGVFLNTVRGYRGKAVGSAHYVVPRAWGRGSEAALEARTQAQHRVFPRALTFVE